MGRRNGKMAISGEIYGTLPLGLSVKCYLGGGRVFPVVVSLFCRVRGLGVAAFMEVGLLSRKLDRLTGS